MSFFEYFDIVSQFLGEWGTFIALIIGLIGNSLCLIVMLHHDMVSSPVPLLIIALAISDTLALISLNIFTGLGSLLRFTFNSNDPLHILLDEVTGLALTTSIGLIVAITIERYLVIVHPFSALSMNTWRQKRIILFVVFIFSICLRTVNITLRLVFLNYPDLILLRAIDMHINAIVVCIIPAIILIVCNLLIGLQIHKSRKIRNAGQLGITRFQNQHNQQDSSTTRMLLSAVLCFLVCYIPQIIYALTPAYVHMVQYNVSVTFLARWTQLGNFACFTIAFQCSINFLIYVAAGTKFRATFKKIFNWRQIKVQQGSRVENIEIG